MYVKYVKYVKYIQMSEATMSSAVADYPSFTDARRHLKEVLDRAERGRTVTIARDGYISAVLAAERLRGYLFRSVAPQVDVAHDNGRVIVLMQDRSFVSEGASVDDALEDLALSLREYAEDWEVHYSQAPNHAANWALVQLVTLSNDADLKEWLEHGGE